MAREAIDPAPLALATMKRFVSDRVLPKRPAELAARFGAELAAVVTARMPRKASARSRSGANRAMRDADRGPYNARIC